MRLAVVRPGEGLVGRPRVTARVFSVANVPAGFLSMATGVGKGRPEHVLVAPAGTAGGGGRRDRAGFLSAARRRATSICSSAAR